METFLVCCIWWSVVGTASSLTRFDEPARDFLRTEGEGARVSERLRLITSFVVERFAFVMVGKLSAF